MSVMGNTTNINVNGLIKHAEEKKRATLEKVDLTIQSIIRNKGTINFNVVSQTSGVSKAYLYKNAEIRERIEMLRNQIGNPMTSKHSKKEMTESSKDIVIFSKNKKIKELEEENKNLKEQLMILRGKLYDNM